MSTQAARKEFRSPLRKLVVFFERSRDGWKSKYFDAKDDLKRLDSRVRYLVQTKGELKARIKELEARNLELRGKQQAMEREVEALKKSDSPINSWLP